jgi:mRNA interferase MazF
MNNKNYDEWNTLKKKINYIYNKPYHPKIREIWWVNLGLNIGSEIYGKGFQYLRPVLVIKINSNNFIGLPLSSKIKRSKNKITIFTVDSKYHSVILSQVRVFDNKRLLGKKYILSKKKFKKIIRRYKNMITTND